VGRGGKTHTHNWAIPHEFTGGGIQLASDVWRFKGDALNCCSSLLCVVPAGDTTVASRLFVVSVPPPHIMPQFYVGIIMLDDSFSSPLALTR
jgi:hypothetical protein